MKWIQYRRFGHLTRMLEKYWASQTQDLLERLSVTVRLGQSGVHQQEQESLTGDREVWIDQEPIKWDTNDERNNDSISQCLNK